MLGGTIFVVGLGDALKRALLVQDAQNNDMSADQAHIIQNADVVIQTAGNVTKLGDFERLVIHALDLTAWKDGKQAVTN